MVLFLDDIHFGLQQHRQLFGLDGALDDRRKGAADEFDHVMVAGDARILLEDVALFGVGDVLLECDKALAPGEAEKVIKHLEQLLVGRAVVRRALETLQDSLDQVNEHLFRRHDHQCPQGGAADDENFGRMDQGPDRPAGPNESREHASYDDDEAGNDQHDGPSGGNDYAMRRNNNAAEVSSIKKRPRRLLSPLSAGEGRGRGSHLRAAGVGGGWCISRVF